METRRALLVDAFTDEPMSGNPAGVVPAADGLADDHFGAIANELGASETAFVLHDDDGTLDRLRYFTPDREVDLCGHATVAAVSHLFETGAVDATTHSVETEAGTVSVNVDDDGTVWMRQREPSIRTVDDVTYETVADALGVDHATLADVGADLPLARASTGLPFLIVPVNYFEHLSDAAPDHDAIAALSEQVGVEGVYAFTFDTLSPDATLHARMFAPLAGVPEDPVTGTGAGAVGAYLRRFGAMDGDQTTFVCEQGHVRSRPGRVRVDVTDGVRIGGRAVTTLDGTLTVPPSSEDDILEA